MISSPRYNDYCYNILIAHLLSSTLFPNKLEHLPLLLRIDDGLLKAVDATVDHHVDAIASYLHAEAALLGRVTLLSSLTLHASSYLGGKISRRIRQQLIKIQVRSTKYVLATVLYCSYVEPLVETPLSVVSSSSQIDVMSSSFSMERLLEMLG